MVEFDKRARLHLQKRRQEKFSYEELVRWLDSQRLGVPYFRRMCLMETSPRDLVIKVMWPNGPTDVYDWGLRQTLFISPSIRTCISRGKDYKTTFYGADTGRFHVTNRRFPDKPTEIT